MTVTRKLQLLSVLVIMPKQAKEQLKYKEFVRFKLLQEFARDDFFSTYYSRDKINSSAPVTNAGPDMKI